MNNHMYEHAATQANIQALRERGVQLIDPDTGRLASRGEHGVGRLAEPARLLAECERVLGSEAKDAHADARSAWHGLRVLISAGGTREPIDGVRFLGNRSSGRMGVALAQAARRRGAQVTLVGANLAVAAPAGVQEISVSTAAELLRACEQRFDHCDVLVMAAAVADFRPSHAVEGKIKKEGRERMVLELEPTVDVLAGLAARKRPDQTIVGFAAEHGSDAVELGRGKLFAKKLDALVVNDVSRADIGFESEDNEATILTATDEQKIPRAAKSIVAEAILDAVQRLRSAA